MIDDYKTISKKSGMTLPWCFRSLFITNREKIDNKFKRYMRRRDKSDGARDCFCGKKIVLFILALPRNKTNMIKLKEAKN